MAGDKTWPPELPTVREPIPEVGALSEWRRQLRDGTRTKYAADPLWRAACAEASARDWVWYPPVCSDYRRQAAAIIVEASAAELAS